MVKVSITLASHAQVTVEAEEAEVARGVVGMVLRELPRDLVLPQSQPNGHPPPPVAGHDGKHEGNNVAASATQPLAVGHPPSVAPPSLEPGGELAAGPLQADSSQAETAFSQFCREASPLGDMRRVVTAAEGARRFLGMADVDEDALGRLFDLAGWRRPHSFTQTLRNTGRSTYRWLERVPGRAGRYTVTPAGRAALGK
jgi:hypothetical protein